MSIESMKQALAVLEHINQLSIGENAIALPGEIDGAMDNLRAAIEQAEKPVAWVESPHGAIRANPLHKIPVPQSVTWSIPLYAAPRQEQYDQTALELCEECGWKAMIPGDGCLVCARQKAKPVAWMYVNTDGECEEIEYGQCEFDDPSIQLLYTAPRQWVGLTDQQVLDLADEHLYGGKNYCILEFYKAIEAKLKEKNQ